MNNDYVRQGLADPGGGVLAVLSFARERMVPVY
jgi:hypothetical protein